jgi:hypothetical protein
MVGDVCVDSVFAPNVELADGAWRVPLLELLVDVDLGPTGD